MPLRLPEAYDLNVNARGLGDKPMIPVMSVSLVMSSVKAGRMPLVFRQCLMSVSIVCSKVIYALHRVVNCKMRSEVMIEGFNINHQSF